MISGTSESGSLDRYVVLEYLAEGGMGAIFIGKKLGAGGFEKPVVLKQLLPEFTSQPEFIDLFLREARLSAALDHANIIHTIDLVTAGAEHFIVMEYLAGGDLRTLLQKAKRRHKRFSPAAAIFIARELLSALAYAHAKLGMDGQPLDLIHRDVSPSNVLISHNGEVKLTDFGIAKAATHNSVFYRVKGKIGYMSPEQARGEDLDHRSDLYSLAVCLYEVLTGERLFVHAGLTTSADEIYSQPVPPVSKKVAGLPITLDQALYKALAINPDERYQTAGEFLDALLRVAHTSGLMMSAPELAAHLADICGAPHQWRDLESDEPEILYEAESEGTERIELSEIEESARDQVHEEHHTRGPVLDEREVREQRAATSMNKLAHFKGLELTSMIRISQEEEGSQPLIDLAEMGAAQGEPFAPPLVSHTPSPPPVAARTHAPPASAPLSIPRPSVAPSATYPTADPPNKLSDLPRPAPPPPRRRSLWPLYLLVLLAGVGTAVTIGVTGPRLSRAVLEGPIATVGERSPAAAAAADAPTAGSAAADEPAANDESAPKPQ
ncbi:serine/threonine protein kinase [Haliangium ochraceum]|uniref:Serine/threonine protein kinase n=1 Tax=Haliangium ochraceum (strain DSM 14365 / JCM 11303 / SMP-2) TaxID=502025 RepID=D0LKZ9_HALO1|nr:serine/threonine-protein kinase [Haliangium ochraceum]ACY16719.1 serine/threonine protein kinase [Haliangium ochraceum DSM 14365]